MNYVRPFDSRTHEFFLEGVADWINKNKETIGNVVGIAKQVSAKPANTSQPGYNPQGYSQQNQDYPLLLQQQQLLQIENEKKKEKTMIVGIAFTGGILLLIILGIAAFRR
jgi:hypothetical protein